MNRKNTSKNTQSKSYYINVEENINVLAAPSQVGKNKIVTEETQDKKIRQIDFSKPRDLYNRPTRLQNHLERVNELPNPDKNDILTHIQFMKDNRRASLTIMRNISALLVMREKLGKPFRDAEAIDVREMFAKLENEGWKTKRGEVKEYSNWADKKFRDVIKKFYRVVFANDESYPDPVKWIKTKFPKDKSLKKLDMRKFLTREQIVMLIDITEGIQRKALLAVGYELGARPGELLALTNLNLREEDGELYCTINESKTNERVIKIVEYKALLKQWLIINPLKHLPVYPLWISEATNYKNQPMGIAGAEKIAEEMIAKVDPTKEAKLYTLRHSRATFLAKCGFSLFDLCDYFGWDYDSDQPKTYIHLTGRDLSEKISALYYKQPHNASKIVLDYCLNCKEELYPNQPLCNRCGESTSVADAYLKGIKKGVENDNATEIVQLKQQVKQLTEIMSKVFRGGEPFPVFTDDGIVDMNIVADKGFNIENTAFDCSDELANAIHEVLETSLKEIETNSVGFRLLPSDTRMAQKQYLENLARYPQQIQEQGFRKLHQILLTRLDQANKDGEWNLQRYLKKWIKFADLNISKPKIKIKE